MCSPIRALHFLCLVLSFSVLVHVMFLQPPLSLKIILTCPTLHETVLKLPGWNCSFFQYSHSPLLISAFDSYVISMICYSILTLCGQGQMYISKEQNQLESYTYSHLHIVQENKSNILVSLVNLKLYQIRFFMQSSCVRRKQLSHSWYSGRETSSRSFLRILLLIVKTSFLRPASGISLISLNI